MKESIKTLFVLLLSLMVSVIVNAKSDSEEKDDFNVPYTDSAATEHIPFYSCYKAKEKAILRAERKCWSFNNVDGCKFERVLSSSQALWQITTGGTYCTVTVLVLGKN